MQVSLFLIRKVASPFWVTRIKASSSLSWTLEMMMALMPLSSTMMALMPLISMSILRTRTTLFYIVFFRIWIVYLYIHIFHTNGTFICIYTLVYFIRLSSSSPRIQVWIQGEVAWSSSSCIPWLLDSSHSTHYEAHQGLFSRSYSTQEDHRVLDL